MAPDLNKGFQLGSWLVEPARGQLSGVDGDRHLEPKVMDVLVQLSSRAGKLVRRDERLRAVWGERAVSDEPLTRAIGELRRALGDSRESPTYIETIPKRGYRLLVPVKHAVTDERRLQRHHRVALAAAVGVAVVAGLWWTGVDRETVISPTDVVVAIDEPARPTIAVLPFCDVGGDDSQPYLGQGLTEDLTTFLARSPELIVISNASAAQFACQPTNLTTVGEELGARYLVTGSVRVSADERMRLTTRLVDTKPDQVIWGDSYERDMSPASVFDMQSEVARQIAHALEIRVMDWEGQAVTNDPTAWELYARGRFVARRAPGREGLIRARELFRQAIAADPSLAEAHAYLGGSYTFLHGFSLNPDPTLLVQAEAHIRRALTLDPKNHVALSQLGLMLLTDGRHEEEVREAGRAMALVPSYDVPYSIRGRAYTLMGELALAQQDLEYAMRLGPRGAHWVFLGVVRYFQGAVSEGVGLLERSRQAIPGVSPALLLAYHYESTGRHEDAQGVIAEILTVHPDATVTSGVDALSRVIPKDLLLEDLEEQLRKAGLP